MLNLESLPIPSQHQLVNQASSAYQSAKAISYDMYKASKVVGYELLKDAAQYSLAFAPTLVETATGIEGLALFTRGLSALHQTTETAYYLFLHGRDIVHQKAELVSPKSVRLAAYAAHQFLILSAHYFMPTGKFYSEMSALESLAFNIHLAHSAFIGARLAYSAYQHFKASNLTGRLSPFSSSKEEVNWQKVAKAISHSVVAALSFSSLKTAFQQTVMQHQVYQLSRNTKVIDQVMEHLPGESRQEVEQFFRLDPSKCNFRQWYFFDYQKEMLSDPKVNECYKSAVEIFRVMSNANPSYLARIFALKNSAEERRFATFQDFLFGSEGLPLYAARSPKEIVELFPSWLESCYSYGSGAGVSHCERMIKTFECYPTAILEKINQFKRVIFRYRAPYMNLDRCFHEQEIDFFNHLYSEIAKKPERRNTHLLFDPLTVEGSILTPAVYLQAYSDWNGALYSLFRYKSGDNAQLNYISNHKNIYMQSISKPDDFCDAFQRAYDALGQKVKHIWISAHGSPKGLVLSDENGERKRLEVGTTFKTSDCFSKYVADYATVVLMACDTAEERKWLPNIAQRITSDLPKGAKVIASFEKLAVNTIELKFQGQDIDVEFNDPTQGGDITTKLELNDLGIYQRAFLTAQFLAAAPVRFFKQLL